MRFKNSDYEKLAERQYNGVKDVTVLVTPFCPGRCPFCELDPVAVGDRDWDAINSNVCNYISLLDYNNQKVNLLFEGGELFADELLTDEYVGNLIKSIGIVNEMTSSNSYLGLSTSLENVSDNGISVIKTIRSLYPRVHVNLEFAVYRISEESRRNRFWKNLETLKYDHLAIGTLITSDKFLEKEYLKTLSKYTGETLAFGELHQFSEKYAFSYANVNVAKEYLFQGDLNRNNLTFLRRGIPAFVHNEQYITSNGILNGLSLRHAPKWIPQDDWNRIRDDEQYRVYGGYQQVLDWYNCNDCEYLMTCQGMLWTSYYAQKNLFNNHKCLYKG